MFSINISMVTNIYSGTASGQALFKRWEWRFSNPSRQRRSISSLLQQQSSDSSGVDLALGFAAHKGFLKMLIHRWYRMLQPSAWLSWDTKLAQICQQGLVFPQKHLFIPLSLLLWKVLWTAHANTLWCLWEKRYCRDDGCQTFRQCFRVVEYLAELVANEKKTFGW